MNSTSPSSSLVRIAARSPARSSAGPDVMCRCTPISTATMPAMRGLAEPGRSGEQQVVGRLAAPRRAASSTIDEVLLQLALADELGERARAAARLVALLDVADRCRVEELVTHAWPPAPSARRAAALTASPSAGSSRSVSRISSGAVAEPGRAPRARRRRWTVPPAPTADRVEHRQVEPAAQLDQQPLGGLLADAGHERQRAEVAGGDDVDQRRPASGWRGSPSPAPDRRRGCAISTWNVVRSSRRRNPKSVCASSRMWWWTYRNAARRRLELGERARRDGDEVADAADLEQHGRVVGRAPAPCRAASRSSPCLAAATLPRASERRRGGTARARQRRRHRRGLGTSRQPEPGLHHPSAPASCRRRRSRRRRP